MAARPVVWALDAFTKEMEVHAKTAHAIAMQAPGHPIFPVYVLSEELFADRGYSSFMRPALRSLAHRQMMSILNHDALWDLRKTGAFHDPEILIEESSETVACVHQVLRYASSINATCIAIGTHGRSLVARFFAGSFAETLLKESALPVIITGPRQLESFQELDAIVLPTDFHPSYRCSFERLLDDLQERELPVHLLQKPREALDVWMQSLAHAWGGGWNNSNGFDDGGLDRDLSADEEAASWIQQAHTKGVKTHVHSPFMTENFRESTTDAIIDYAKNLKGFSPAIAMLHDCHPDSDHDSDSETFMLRNLIRVSPYPIYVTGNG